MPMTTRLFRSFRHNFCHPLRSELSIRLWIGLLVLVGVMATGGTTVAVAAGLATDVGGAITTPVTWTLAGSPYVVTSGIVISTGGNLTIEPGVQVKFNAGAYLQVQNGGIFNAQGTQAQPIHFLSNAATPAPGDWAFVSFEAGSSGGINHCLVRHGGSAFGAAQLIIGSSNVTVQNCTIADGANDGIRLTQYDIAPTLHNLVIERNAQRAINQAGVRMQPIYQNVTLIDNGLNALAMNYAANGNSTLGQQLTFGSAGVNGAPLYFDGGLSVDSGSTVTITAGSQVIFTPSSTLQVTANSRLVAAGTSAQPVVFGSAATPPAPGDWNYIYFHAQSSGHLNHCVVRHAGRAGAEAQVRIDATNVVVENCTIAEGARDGVRLGQYNIAPTLRNVIIERNVGSAINQAGVRMNPVYNNLTLRDNGRNAVNLNYANNGGATSGAHVTLDSSQLNGAPFVVDGELTVDANSVITFTPGTTLYTIGGGATRVRGGSRLVAAGTPTQTITFAPISALTGTPAPGDWIGVVFDVGSSGRLAHCDIGHAGNAALAALSIYADEVYVSHCTVHHSKSNGLVTGSRQKIPYSDLALIDNAGYALLNQTGGSTPVALRKSILIRNGAGGVRNDSSTAFVDARYNWWGHHSGPNHPTLNLSGQGSSVSDKVFFDPWMFGPDGTFSIEPRVGGNNGAVTISAAGPDFVEGATMRLRRTGSADLVAPLSLAVDRAENGVWQATFTMSNAAVGDWDVIVDTGAGETLTAPAAFKIEAAGEPDPFVQIVGAGAFRRNQGINVAFVYGNRGNVDAPPAYVRIGTSLRLRRELKSAIAARFEVDDSNPDEVMGVIGFHTPPLPANTTTIVVVRLNTDVVGNYPIDMWMLSPDIAEPITDVVPSQIEFTVPTYTSVGNGFDAVIRQETPGSGSTDISLTFRVDMVEGEILPSLKYEEVGDYIELIFSGPMAPSALASAAGIEPNAPQARGSGKLRWVKQHWLNAVDTVAYKIHSTRTFTEYELKHLLARQYQDEGVKRYRRALVDCMMRNGYLTAEQYAALRRTAAGKDTVDTIKLIMNTAQKLGVINVTGGDDYVQALSQMTDDAFYIGLANAVANNPTILEMAGGSRRWRELADAVQRLCERNCKLPQSATGVDAAEGLAFDEIQACFSRTWYEEATGDSVSAIDPNDKSGPQGAGIEHFIRSDTPIPYMIRFENVITATAPAQVVTISDTIDIAKLDLGTLRLHAFGFGDTIVPIASSDPLYETMIDLRPAKNLLVLVRADVSPAGLLTWRFESLDPVTLAAPADPFAGFLPPNDATGRGQGFVLFSLMPKAGLAPGTQIINRADIRFDDEAVIRTNTWSNIVDDSAPQSAVDALAAVQTRANFPVSWAGNDTGSGVKDYTVWVSVDGAPFEPWLIDTQAASATFLATQNRTYRFYVEARDRAGNLEVKPIAAEATTRVANLNFLPVVGR